MKSRMTRNILPALLAFLGIGALAGGGILIISPYGRLMGMPLSMLKESPFTNFLIPGVLLFFVLGVIPLLLVLALMKKWKWNFADHLNIFGDMYWPWAGTIYVAFALIVWIQMEMVLLGSIHWLHTFYMFYAIVLLSGALMPSVRALYKK